MSDHTKCILRCEKHTKEHLNSKWFHFVSSWKYFEISVFLNRETINKIEFYTIKELPRDLI